MKSKLFKLLIAGVAVILLLWLLDDSGTKEQLEANIDTRPSVSVIEVTPKTVETSVSVTGLLMPRWKVSLTSNVRGQVTESFETILPGSFVKKGQVIAQIDDVEYTAALNGAKANETAAILELERFLNEQSVARTLDNGSAINDYRLYKPHVEAAKASLKAAKANVAVALKQLNDTRIKAPFDAIVLAKHIAPSQQLNGGETVYTLASSDALDVEVSLSSEQWQRVNLNQQTSATVENAFNQRSSAQVRYLAPMLDSQTRQRGVTLAINEPYENDTNLLPEQQVDIVFASNPIEYAVVTPATVLTRDNQVWTVTENRLALEQIQLIEENPDTIIFRFSANPDTARQIVLYPLSTMLKGQVIKAEISEFKQGDAL